MPIDGVAPAVVNALRHLGLDVREIPALPERVMEVARVELGLAERTHGA
jgi:CO/xanthine dehydrogenase Mo-binding subunit